MKSKKKIKITHFKVTTECNKFCKLKNWPAYLVFYGNTDEKVHIETNLANVVLSRLKKQILRKRKERSSESFYRLILSQILTKNLKYFNWADKYTHFSFILINSNKFPIKNFCLNCFRQNASSILRIFKFLIRRKNRDKKHIKSTDISAIFIRKLCKSTHVQFDELALEPLIYLNLFLFPMKN